MLASTYENATVALPHLIDAVMKYGRVVPSRNGETRELGPVQIQLREPGNGYMTTPGRKASVVAQIAETMWILYGRNDVEWLSRYLPRAPEFSDDGKVWRGGYGPRIRAFGAAAGTEYHDGMDQLRHVVDLLKEDPDTRRAVINIYDPMADFAPGKDIPCNNWLHFLYRDGQLGLHVATRSNDLIWGWSGINAFEWNALLQVVAGLTGLKPGGITFSISSLHIYAPYYDRAKAIMDTARTKAGWGTGVTPVRAAPGFQLDRADTVDTLDDLIGLWFALELEIRELSDGPGDSEKLAGLVRKIWHFPEERMQSWLFALLAWNTRDLLNLPAVFRETDLALALDLSPARKFPEVPPPAPAAAAALAPATAEAFLRYVQDLHAEKDKAYGDSWCRRGEQMAIMANIARKVDRLGVPGAGDTASDSALDMAVYLVKYSIWHQSNKQGRTVVLPFTGPEHVTLVSKMLGQLDSSQPENSIPTEELIDVIRRDFDRLEQLVKANTSRGAAIHQLAQRSWMLARRLWIQEQEQEQKKQAWKDGNADRPFNGYNEPEGDAA